MAMLLRGAEPRGVGNTSPKPHIYSHFFFFFAVAETYLSSPARTICLPFFSEGLVFAMDHDLSEMDPVAPVTDDNGLDTSQYGELAEAGSVDDCGPAFFEEEEECVALLSSVQKALLQQPMIPGKEEKDEEDLFKNIPTAVSDPHGVAAALERFEHIITHYQESPHLLHGCLETLLSPLVTLLQHLLPTAADVWRMEESGSSVSVCNTAYDEDQHVLGKCYDEYDSDAPKTAVHHISRAIYILVKTAGEKCCTSYFPNDVKLYEDVFYALRWWQRSPARRREWEVRYCLLLWLSNLVLVPFLLSIIDSAGGSGSLSDAVLQMSMTFLGDTSKCREGAALLVARLLSRPDSEAHRSHFFAYVQGVILEPTSSSHLLYGVLVALAKTMKFGQRRELTSYAPQLIPKVVGVFENRSTEALLCKAAVKVLQRLTLVMLKARSAPWKYQRLVASLAENLADSSAPVDANKNSHNYVIDDVDDDYMVENDEGLEDVIGLLLVAVSHKDTVVRWSAAKGIARICDRLPRAMAEDVITAVLDVFGNEHSDSGWHGGLLTLAELCRRSILHPQHLVRIVPLVTRGLAFDLIKGTYSVGSHVRDAACYVCWSVARAYNAADIETHVHQLASSLVVTSLFDREVHVRRAAAAAFQECVGRLGNFPDGIRLVTTMDFFSLASLQNAYHHVAPQVAENEAYMGCMLEELVVNKLLHWDRRVRCCAAHALGLLATRASHIIINEAVPELLIRVTDCTVATRHGAILALAELVDALDASVWPEKFVESLAALTPRVDAARLFRSRGGEYVRQACCKLLATVARHRLPLPEIIEVPKLGGGSGGSSIARVRTLGKLQEFFEDTWKQILEWLQFDAIDAYEAFCAAYYTDFSAPFHHKVLEKVMSGSAEDRNPIERRGNLLALGAFPWAVIAAPLPGMTDCVYFMSLLEIAMRNTKLEERKDAQDAASRRNAVRSLRKILLRIPTGTPQLTTELYERIMQHILETLNDYTADRRGDVGSFVRLEAIESLPVVVQYGLQSGHCSRLVELRVVQALIKQTMEKLDRLRGRAVLALHELLRLPGGLLAGDSSCPIIMKEEGDNESVVCDESNDVAVLRNVLQGGASNDWTSPQIVSATLARPLLRTKVFAPCVVEGLVVSAGSLSVHIMRPAMDALLDAVRASPDDCTRLSKVLIAVAAKYVHNERVLVPLCVTIDGLLNAGLLDESYHIDVVEILRHELKHYATNIHVLLPLVGLLGNLCRSTVPSAREAAWALSLVMLASRYPKVRAKMGLEMYTSLLVVTSEDAGDGCAVAMRHLTATQWDANDATRVRGARDELYGMLGIARPTRETSGDTLEVKKKTNRVVAGSYMHLVHEAGY